MPIFEVTVSRTLEQAQTIEVKASNENEAINICLDFVDPEQWETLEEDYSAEIEF